MDSPSPYATSSNDIEDFLGVPTREEVIGQRFSYLSAIYICSIIIRSEQVPSGGILCQNLPRGARDFDFPTRFLLVDCDDFVDGLGIRLQIHDFSVVSGEKITMLSPSKRRAFPESSEAVRWVKT